MSNLEIRKFFLVELAMVLWFAYLYLFGYPWHVYTLALAGSVLAVVNYEVVGKVGRTPAVLLGMSVLFMISAVVSVHEGAP